MARKSKTKTRSDAQGSNGFVRIEAPLSAEIPQATFGVHVDIQLTGQTATAVRRLAHSLDAQQATTANGRRVVGVAAAVRWLLEELAKEAAA